MRFGLLKIVGSAEGINQINQSNLYATKKNIMQHKKTKQICREDTKAV